MVEFEPWELRLAWQEVWQVRGCPPDDLLRTSERTPELERHLKTCPLCTEHLSELALDAPMTGMLSSSAEAGRGATVFHKDLGQIWSIRPALGGWGPKERHYNPPLVLIVRRPGNPEEAVQVVQVYHDRVLAGPGDIPLGETLFAETWNTYTLSEKDLETFWDRIDDSTLRAVHHAMTADAAPLPEDCPPLIEAFRRLEIEVGAFFAVQSIETMLRRLDRAPSDCVRSYFPSAESMTAYFRDCHPSLILSQASSDVLERLALARFPSHELPLAAAGTENRILVNRLVWTSGRPDLTPERAELTVWKATDEGLTLGGHIEGIASPESELLVWWGVSNQPPVPASEVDFSGERGYFRVRFQGLTRDQQALGRPVLLLCDRRDASHPIESEP